MAPKTKAKPKLKPKEKAKAPAVTPSKRSRKKNPEPQVNTKIGYNGELIISYDKLNKLTGE